MVSVATGNIELSTAIAGPILIPLILFAGYFLNNEYDNIKCFKINFSITILLSSTRAYFVWIKYISWFYYTFEILMTELWTSYDYIPCSKPFKNVTTSAGTVLCKNARCYANGDAVLDQYAVKKVSYNENFIFCLY